MSQIKMKKNSLRIHNLFIIFLWDIKGFFHVPNYEKGFFEDLKLFVMCRVFI